MGEPQFLKLPEGEPATVRFIGEVTTYEHVFEPAPPVEPPMSEACASGNHYRCREQFPECWCARCHAVDL